MASHVQPRAGSSPAPVQVLASRHFYVWLQSQDISLGFSTYQSGKLFLVGRKPVVGQLSVFERTFNRCMGLWSDGQSLWLASAYQLWRLENPLAPGVTDDGFDRQFVPRIGYTTGDIDVHDVAIEGSGRPLFISTLFSCLATTHDRFSFAPLWRPKFISKLAPEDRCHLNGLAMENGTPRYATACSQSNIADGWRDVRHNGGCVIDIVSDEIVAAGFSMPHSPRLYRDKLWLLDSGNGNFGYLDRSSGKFEVLTFCAGYARGLAFVGDYAIVGVSRPRHEQTFKGLPLDDALAAHKAVARCGLQVIDLRNGDVAHWLKIEGVVEELYDVVCLNGVTRPAAMGFKTDDIRRNVWVEENGRPVRWSALSCES
jgi:uncharacterized protein (TIGR03032 family)